MSEKQIDVHILYLDSMVDREKNMRGICEEAIETLKPIGFVMDSKPKSDT